MRASQLPNRAAQAVVTLQRSDFADGWDKKPKGGVAFGLRTLSDADESMARVVAETAVAEKFGGQGSYDGWVEEYNDALASGIVGISICDPNNNTKWPDALPFPQDTLRDALVPGAIRRLFDEYMMMQARIAPGLPEATPEEVGALIDLLPELPDEVLSTVLKMIKRALEIAES
jgi:hypothetical protein